MAKLFSTVGSTLDTIDEGAQYIKDRISVLRYDAVYENFSQWFSEKRPAESIPPHMRDDYSAYVKAKLKQEK